MSKIRQRWLTPYRIVKPALHDVSCDCRRLPERGHRCFRGEGEFHLVDRQVVEAGVDRLTLGHDANRPGNA